MNTEKITSIEKVLLEDSREVCEKLRGELQDKFSFIWLFLYQRGDKCQLSVVNAFGGKLEDSIVGKLEDYIISVL